MSEYMTTDGEGLLREDRMDLEKDTIYEYNMDKDTIYECDMDKDVISKFEDDTVDVLNKFDKSKLVKANKYNMNVSVEVDLKELVKVSKNTGSLVFYIIDKVDKSIFDVEISLVNRNIYLNYLQDSPTEVDVLDKPGIIRFYTVCDGVCIYCEYTTKATIKAKNYVDSFKNAILRKMKSFDENSDKILKSLNGLMNSFNK